MGTVAVYPVTTTSEHNPDQLTLSGNATLSSTGKFIQFVFANSTGYTLTIPDGRTHKIYNNGTNTFNVTSASVSSTPLPAGESLNLSWDPDTDTHHSIRDFFPADRLRVTGHGLTSADVGKPLGFRSNGTLVVWDNLATTETPAFVLRYVLDTNNIQIGGHIVSIAKSLFPADHAAQIAATNQRYYYWWKSATKYDYTSQSGSVRIQECVYVMKEDHNNSSNYLCLCLVPERPVI